MSFREVAPIQFVALCPFPLKPAKALFSFAKSLNAGLVCTDRLSLTMAGVLPRDIDDAEGLQSSDYSVYQIVEQDDLLFKLIDLQNIKTSRVGHVPSRGIVSPAYIRLRPADDSVCVRYYFWFFYAMYSQSIFNAMGAGVRQTLNQSDLLSVHIPVPDQKQQHAIASYLDTETARIDGLIAAKGELLALLRGLDLTAFFSALSARANGKPGRTDDQVRWLANLPVSWERCKVKHLVLSFDQGVSPQCESRVPDEGEWGVLKVGCVNTGRFEPLESKALPPEIAPVPEVTVEEGDLLVSRANTKDLVGRSAVAANSYTRLMLSDKLYRLKLDRKRCLPDFVRRLMWIPAVRQMIEERATGASPSMLNIDRRTILELPIPLPPVDEQEQILREAEKANSAAQDLIRHVENEIDLLREMRSATITDAVLGRIDVRAHMKH